MSIASELSTLAANKAAIKAAIEAKSPETAPTGDMSQWATAIESIPTGGGLDGFTKIEYSNGLVAYYGYSGAILGYNVLSSQSIVKIEFGTDVSGIGGFWNINTLEEVAVHGNRTNRTLVGRSVYQNADDQSFNHCDNLVSFEADEYVDFGSDVFYNTPNLHRIVFTGRTAAQVRAMANYPFSIGAYTSGNPEGSVTVVCDDTSFTLPFWPAACFPTGTKILMADRTEKNIEDVRYGDALTVWDFDEGRIGTAPVCWLTRDGLINDHFYELTFSDGTILRTTGRNSNHKVYNVDKRKFEGVNKTEVGDRIYSIGGIVSVTSKRYVEERVNYYNLMTSRKINCFANGILTSDRYGNMYPIDANMVYDKAGRTTRPYSVYEAAGINRYWYDNLRLGEVDETVEETVKYIAKVRGQGRDIEDLERGLS